MDTERRSPDSPSVGCGLYPWPRDVCFNPAVSDRTTSRDRERGDALAVATVALPLVTIAACGGGHGRARGSRTSSTTPRHRASTTPTTASSSSSSAAASPRSTATATGATSCSSPAAATPAALYHNDSPAGGALRFTQLPSAGHRPHRGHRRVPARHRQRRADRPRRAAPRRRRRAARPRATAGSRTPTRRSGIDGGDAWTGRRVQRRRGRARTRLPTLAFGDYLRARTGTGATTAGSSGPDATGERYAPPIALDPRLLHAVDAVQRLGPHRPARPADVERPALLPSTARSSCGGSTPGEAPRAYTEADGWRPLQIWGMGIASQDLTGDGLPGGVPHEPGRQQAADARRRPRTADVRRHRPGARASPRSGPFTGGDVLPSTAWHPEFADVNNDGFVDLLVTKGNVDAQVDQAQRDPNNLFIGQPDGTFVEGAEEAGIVVVRAGARRGRRRPQPRRPARHRGRQPARRTHAVAQRRPRRRRAAGGDGSLDRRPPAAARAERRRHRRVGGGARRRADDHAARSPSAAGHVSGELGWLHSGIGSADRRRGARAVAGRHASGRG